MTGGPSTFHWRAGRSSHRRARLFVGLALTGLAFDACETAPLPAAAPRLPVDVVGAEILRAEARFDATGPQPLGGLSGLTQGETDDEVFAITDEHEAPRIVALRISLPKGQLHIEPTGFLPLDVRATNPDGAPAADFEAMVRRRDGHWFVTSEGDGRATPRIAPVILELDAHLQTLHVLELPAKFVPDPLGPATSGVRANLAFESLALSPDESRLFAGTESPLTQDGEEPSFTAGGLSRLLTFERDGASYRASSEYVYPLDQLHLPPRFGPSLGSNGMSEMLAVNDHQLLVLERAFIHERDGSRSVSSIRLYLADLDGAEDVSGLPSLVGHSPTPVRKVLVVDLATLVPHLPARLATLENFEGMTWGPPARGGAATLLLVSDNNFNPKQSTAFVLLKVRGLQVDPAFLRRPRSAGPGHAHRAGP